MVGCVQVAPRQSAAHSLRHERARGHSNPAPSEGGRPLFGTRFGGTPNASGGGPHEQQSGATGPASGVGRCSGAAPALPAGICEAAYPQKCGARPAPGPAPRTAVGSSPALPAWIQEARAQQRSARPARKQQRTRPVSSFTHTLYRRNTIAGPETARPRSRGRQAPYAAVRQEASRRDPLQAQSQASPRALRRGTLNT